MLYCRPIASFSPHFFSNKTQCSMSFQIKLSAACLFNYTITIRLPYNYHTITIQLPYDYHTITIQLPYNYHTIIIQLSYNYHTITIQLSYNYHTIIIQLSYNYHTIIIQLSYNYHTITRVAQRRKIVLYNKAALFALHSLPRLHSKFRF